MAVRLAFSPTSRSPLPLNLPSLMDKRWSKQTPTDSPLCTHQECCLWKPHLLLGSGWGCSNVQGPLYSLNILPVFCTRFGILWNRFCELRLTRSLHYSPGRFSNFILQISSTKNTDEKEQLDLPQWFQKRCLATDFQGKMLTYVDITIVQNIVKGR